MIYSSTKFSDFSTDIDLEPIIRDSVEESLTLGTRTSVLVATTVIAASMPLESSITKRHDNLDRYDSSDNTYNPGWLRN